MKSIVFYSNFFEDACAYLRVLGPLKRLGIDIITGKEESGVIHPERVGSGDLVLLQRDFPRDFIVFEKIINLSRRNQKPVVFELDDLLFMLPENHPARINHHYTEALLPMLDALGEVDCITVSTAKLKEILSPYKKEIFVLPNYFDDSIWKLRTPVIKKPDEPVVIGFMGTETHQPDIEYVAPALEKILKQHSEKVLIYFWGVKPARKLTDYPQVIWIPAKTYNYLEFAKYFQTQYSDIFIAPLVDNAFNSAKSPLKFLEYSALGTPGVYSRIEPYQQVIVHGENGFLASSLDEWEENIHLLINNQELRLQLAVNAQTTIRDNWLLSKNMSIWQETYDSLKALKKGENSSINNELIRSITLQNYHLHQRIKEQAETKASMAWKFAMFFRKIRMAVIPPNSSRAKIARFFFHWLQGEKIKLIRRKKVI
ncbi:MAG: glycosyltransferase [Bellilinea sp.]